MAKGLLTFTGTIDLNQFWPKNINGKSPYDSDADTVKVKIDMASIQFATGAGKVKKTKALNNAGFWKNVKKSNGTVVKKFFPVINSNNIVTIRLPNDNAKPKLVNSLVTNGAITITSPGNFDYYLADLNGRILNKGKLSAGMTTVNANNMVNGMYIIRFTDGIDQWTEKLVKQ